MFTTRTTQSPTYDTSYDDECTYAWDIPAVNPTIGALHVQAVLLPADEDQPDELVEIATDLVRETIARRAQGLCSEADVEAAWTLLLEQYDA